MFHFGRATWSVEYRRVTAMAEDRRVRWQDWLAWSTINEHRIRQTVASAKSRGVIRVTS